MVLGNRTTNRVTGSSTGGIILSVNQNFKGPTFSQIEAMTRNKRLMRLYHSHMTATAKRRLTPHFHRVGTKINFFHSAYSAPFVSPCAGGGGFLFLSILDEKGIGKTMYHFSLPEQWNQKKGCLSVLKSTSQAFAKTRVRVIFTLP